MNRHEQLVSRVLARYDLDIVHHEHVRTSENLVVKLMSGNGRAYALRIRRIIGAYREQVMSELVILRDYSEYSHADIPAPVPARDGQLYCIITDEGNEYLCVVFKWVAGRHVGGHELTSDHMASMARAVARWHDFARTYRPAAKLARPVYDEEWFFGAQSWSTSPDFVGRMLPSDADYLRSMQEAVRTRLRQYPTNADTFGLIHYDLHVGNFLFDGDEANMIDFDECGSGYYLFDLAHILFEFIGDPRFEAFQSIVAGCYTNGREAGAYSKSDLGLFLALQGIAYANWLYRIFRRDGNHEAMKYWVPVIVRRVQAVFKTVS